MECSDGVSIEATLLALDAAFGRRDFDLARSLIQQAYTYFDGSADPQPALSSGLLQERGRDCNLDQTACGVQSLTAAT